MGRKRPPALAVASSAHGYDARFTPMIRHLLECSEGISIAPALDTTAAVIILASPLPCELMAVIDIPMVNSAARLIDYSAALGLLIPFARESEKARLSTKISPSSQNFDRHPPMGCHCVSREFANVTLGTMIMPKTLLSLEELRGRAFEAIQQHDGCEGVSDVTICEIADDSATSNWRIGAVGVSAGWASAATRAAVCVQDELQHDFDLLIAL